MKDLPELQRSPEYGVFQLNEYIRSFQASSDRARYVVFITTAVSLLMLIADWNVLGWSWSRRAREHYEKDRRAELGRAWDALHAQQQLLLRFDELRKNSRHGTLDAAAVQSELVSLLAAQARVNALSRPSSDLFWMPRAEWIDSEWDGEWYGGQMREFYGRAVFVPIPGLGASIHVNDIALVGGVVLLALSVLLWISLVREHENLHLAVFKIARICRDERNPSDRDSVANFLYHALAMAQALSYPPTLARWNHSLRVRATRGGAWLVYLLPALTDAIVVGQNIASSGLASREWGRWMYLRLSIQIALALAILGFCMLAGTYARAIENDWRHVFERINPALVHFEQPAWSEWVHLSTPDANRDQRQLARELMYTATVRAEPHASASHEKARHPTARFATLAQRGPLISRKELRDTVDELLGPNAKHSRFRRMRLKQNTITIAGRTVRRWDVRVWARVSPSGPPPSPSAPSPAPSRPAGE